MYCFMNIDGDDYSAVSTTFNFTAPLNASASVCTSVPILDDNITEPCEDFGVTLTSDSERSCIVGDNSTTVQINDDEGEYIYVE